MDKLIEKALNITLPERTSLNIPNNFNFGLEIETESLDFIKNAPIFESINEGINVKQDKSLIDYGLEIETPVLQNKKEHLLMLRELATTITSLKPTFDNCSLQVNIDNDLGTNSVIDLLKVYGYFEKVLARFSMSFKPELREMSRYYASLIRYEFMYEALNHDPSKIIEFFKNKKDFSINLKEDKKSLIEFRLPNGCSNITIWLNYVDTYYNLYRVVKEKKFDNERILDGYLKFQKKYDKEYLGERRQFKYNEEELLEFVNLIFEDELDKLYFIEQYMGYQYKKRR